MNRCPHCFAKFHGSQKEHEKNCSSLWLQRRYAYLKTLPDAEYQTKKFDDWCDENCG